MNTELYIDLLKRCILDEVYGGQLDIGAYGQLASVEAKENGTYWPHRAHSMIGHKRMDNIRFCVEQCLKEQIPGDFIETGVWRGGATIFMRGLLKAYNIQDRCVYVADSFEGLPEPESRYPVDVEGGYIKHPPKASILAVPVEEVKKTFANYNLLDDQVRFLQGFFETTLPNSGIEKLAILRMDGDMYSSTIQTLDALYDRVSPGGFIIIDDYALRTCRAAVDDFRRRRNITVPLQKIDFTGYYWRKPMPDVSV